MSGAVTIKYEQIHSHGELAIRFIIDGGKVWIPRSVCAIQDPLEVGDGPGEIRVQRWWRDAHSPQLRMRTTRTALLDAGYDVSFVTLESLGELRLRAVTEWAEMWSSADDERPFTPSWLDEFAIEQEPHGEDQCP